MSSDAIAVWLRYQDDRGLDLASLRLWLNEREVTGEVHAEARGAQGTLRGLGEGAHRLAVEITDREGRCSRTEARFVVDTRAPELTLLEPLSDQAWNGVKLHVRGRADDASPVQVRVNSQAVPVRAGGFELRDLSAPATATSFDVVVEAEDASGHVARVVRRLALDRTAPQLVLASPAEGAHVAGPDVAVSGRVRDASATSVRVQGQDVPVVQGQFSTRIPLPSGRVLLHIEARDAAGHRSAVARQVDVDSAAPEVALEAAPDTVAQADASLSGQVHDQNAVQVELDGQPVPVDAQGRFTLRPAWPADGEQRLRLVARDALGHARVLERQVRVDRSQPELTIASPEPREVRAGSAFVVQGTVKDASAVEVRVAGVLARRLGSVWVAQVPGRTAGEHTLDIEARDAAGNTRRGVHRVRVVAGDPGVMATMHAGGLRAIGPQASSSSWPTSSLEVQPGVSCTGTCAAARGQALDDATGLPLAGVNVLVGGSTVTSSDASGRYRLTDASGVTSLSFSKSGYSSAARVVAGSVDLLDVRLTPLAPTTTVDTSGGTLSASVPRRLRTPDPGAPEPLTASIEIAIPAGALAAPRALRLTALSPQGLPLLLPLGYSPLVAFDWRADDGGALPTVTAQMTGLPSGAWHWARYDAVALTWQLVATTLTPTAGVLDVSVGSAGVFALIAADEGPTAPTLPAVGAALTAVPALAIPPDATSRSLALPASLPPRGGQSRLRLVIETSSALPSGTLAQADLEETYTLTSGQTAAQERRRQDVLLYQHDLEGVEAPVSSGHTLAAELPLRPAREFDPALLVEGHLHLDLLAGRTAQPATTLDSEGGSVQAGDATVTIPAGALSGPTLIALETAPPSGWLPSGTDLQPLAEVALDLGGATLSAPATLSLAITNAPTWAQAFCVARVVGIEGSARLQVVAWATLANEHITTTAHALFPGLRQGGPHVVYALGFAPGFLHGVVRHTGTPTAAWVSSASLPFVHVTSSDGAYALPVRAGQATAYARVSDSPLATSASATASAGQSATLDLDLVAQPTTVTVTPPDGSTGVPAETQIELVANAAFEPASVIESAVLLRRASDQAPVAGRLVLSSDGRRAAFIPASRLQPATAYEFSATGLRDAFGRTLVVLPVTFTTRTLTAQGLDLDALVFTYPVDGRVRATLPAGSWPSGTRLLVVNSANGQVVGATVATNAALDVPFDASLDDRLLITVTDPEGHELFVERAQYVAADGRTGLGLLGGRVLGPGGVELRVPAGALSRATTLRVTPIAASAVPADQRPDLPGAHFAGGLLIEAPDKPRFQREVDLVFPKPAEAPAGAFFYVYQRVQSAGGRLAFVSLDQAFVEGGRVVTASPPFPGYRGDLGTFSGWAQAFVETQAYLLWTFDELLPGRPLPGVIYGRVVRPVFVAGQADPEYVGVPGLLVSGVNDQNGRPTIEDSPGHPTLAFTSEDGSFALLDARFEGGLVRVAARVGANQYAYGTAFATNVVNSQSYNLRYYTNRAEVTITLPPTEPAPGAAEASLGLARREADGRRTPLLALVSEGTPLVVGVRVARGELRQVRLDGVALPFARDDFDASQGPRFDFVVDQALVASPAGTHRIEVEVRGDDGIARPVGLVFRVVPEGGGNSEPLPGVAPEVLTAASFPTPGTQDLPVPLEPRLVFSEPVRGLFGHVHLEEIDVDGTTRALGVRLLGVAPQGGDPVEISSATQAVVSLVVLPEPGLSYGRRYRLTLDATIEDLDPEPRTLATYVSEFSTYGPGEPTSQGTFAAPALAVQDGFAYTLPNVAGANGPLSLWSLATFDVREPSAPVEVGDRQEVSQRPMDMASQSGALVVGTTSTHRPFPSNLWLYDLSAPEAPVLAGIGSVSSGPVDGAMTRVALRGRYAYALLWRKGVVKVDLARVRQNYQAVLLDTEHPDRLRDMQQRLNTEGQGFGLDAVVAVVPLPVLPGGAQEWSLRDLAVGELPLQGRVQPTVFVAGSDYKRADLDERERVVVGNPQTGAVVSEFAVTVPGPQGARTLRPVALALGRAAGREVLAVVGSQLDLGEGVQSSHLVAFDVSNPAQPQVLGRVALGVTDVSQALFDGERVLVASARGEGSDLVSLADPTQPYLAAHFAGLSGAIASDGQGAYFSVSGTATSAGAQDFGLHSATLDPACDLLALRTPQVDVPVVRDPDTGSLCGGVGTVTFTLCKAGQVSFRIDGQAPAVRLDDDSSTAPVIERSLGPGLHVLQVPFAAIGQTLHVRRDFEVAARSASDARPPVVKPGRITGDLVNRAMLPIGHTLEKGVDLLDGHLVRQSSDLALPGRHLGLEVLRSYSSAGAGDDGDFGAGWGFNYTAAVQPMGCGLVSVGTPEGGSQVFRTTDQGATFTPQKGYHTRLIKHAADGSYEFIDKAGVRHYYREPVDPNEREGALRLDRVVEPHGDRLEMAYDLRGRLAEAREVLRDGQRVRSVRVQWAERARRERIVRITSSLGHEVSYDYDDVGNLVSVERSGNNVDGQPSAEPQRERFEYDTGRLDDPHQLTAAVGSNGAARPGQDRVEYVYHAASDAFPGEAQLAVTKKQEFVKAVRELGAASPDGVTGFAYDYSGAAAPTDRVVTTLTDARGAAWRYAMTSAGLLMRKEDPGVDGGPVRATEFTWRAADFLRESQTDALGRVTTYGYDERGNLTREELRRGTTVLRVKEREYEATFNKETRSTLSGVGLPARTSTFTIDPATGDRTAEVDALGNRTEYSYDAAGQLVSTRDARGFVTSFSTFNTFGSAGAETRALGQVVTRVRDARNRVVDEQQVEPRRRVTTVYDGFDRKVEVRGHALGSGGDALARFEYYPGGEKRREVSALGAVTEYELDGQNRALREVTTLAEEGRTLVMSRAYDANGNVLTATDGRGVRRGFEYDARNQKRVERIDAGLVGEGPTGVVGTYGYDAPGRLIRSTDVAGLVTEYERDDLDNVVLERLPQAPLTKAASYNAAGQVLSSTDANGHVTTMEYDLLGRLTRVVKPLGHELRYEYNDPQGSHVLKSAEVELPRGLRTEYVYDALGRETQRRVILQGDDGDPATNNVTHTTTTAYAGDTTTVTDALGVKTRSTQDGLGREVERVVDVEGLALTTRQESDGAGNVVWASDAAGRETRATYDGLGRLRARTDALGNVSAWDYDNGGLKTRETDREQVTRLFTHDNLGRPRTTALESAPKGGVGWSRAIEYRDVERERRETDARGFVTTTALDGLNRETRVTDALGHWTEMAWDGVNKRSVRDPRGHVTTYDYDALDRVVTVTDPAPFTAQTQQTVYDDVHNRVTQTDRRGTATVTQSDALGRAVSVTRGGVLQERNEYDARSNKVLAEDGNGAQTRFVFDGANRLTERRDGLGTPVEERTRYAYDAAGNRITEIDARASEAQPSRRWQYDGLDRMTAEIDGEGRTTTYAYDTEGRRTASITPDGLRTDYAYDELGKLLRVTQPAGADGQRPVTAYVYDAERDVVRQTDAEGHVVEKEYDALGRLLRFVQKGPADLVTTYVYDARGNETQHTDPLGQVTATSYDALNRPTEVTFTAAASGAPETPWRFTSALHYGYDANGNVVSLDDDVVSASGGLSTLHTTRVYDALDRLTSDVQALPGGGTRAQGFSYWPNGLRQTVTDATGQVSAYAYDGRNRLAQETAKSGTPQAEVTTYAYWPDGLLREVVAPNGATTAQAYDRSDRLLSVSTSKGGVVRWSYAYTYDVRGNRLSQVEVNGGLSETTTYGYDGLDRLVSVVYPIDAAHTSGRTVTYGYDRVGNRVRETETTGVGVVTSDKTAVFDGFNRLTSVTDAVASANSATFTYDANGNLRSKTTGGVTSTYVYDLRDKLVEAREGTQVMGRFQYDADERRSLKIGEFGVQQFVYDGTSLLEELDGNGVQQARYEWGSDRLISLFRTTEPRRYFSFDGLGSVVGLTDTAGASVAAYHLDAWGGFRFPAERSASVNRFAFTGYYLDTETDLYYAKARYFDPDFGRFLTQDSYLGEANNPPSLHRYFYANANPTRYVDPTGHAAGEFKGLRTTGIDEATGLPVGTYDFDFTDEVTVNATQTRDQEIATFVALTDAHTKAYGKQVAKAWVAGAAGAAVGAGAAVALGAAGVGATATAVGSELIGGGVLAGTDAALHGAGTRDVLKAGATGAVLGAGLGQLVRYAKIGAGPSTLSTQEGLYTPSGTVVEGRSGAEMFRVAGAVMPPASAASRGRISYRGVSGTARANERIAEAFEQGLRPRGGPEALPTDTNLLESINEGSRNSAFVQSSWSRDVATTYGTRAGTRGGVVFEIEPGPSAIDVGSSHLRNRVLYPEQKIVAHPGGVPRDQILRAHVVDKTGAVVKTIERPN